MKTILVIIITALLNLVAILLAGAGVIFAMVMVDSGFDATLFWSATGCFSGAVIAAVAAAYASDEIGIDW